MSIIDDVLGIVPGAISSQDIKVQFDFDASDIEQFGSVMTVCYANIRNALNAQIPLLWKQNELNNEANKLKAEVYSKGGGVQELNRQIKADDAVITIEANLEAIRISLQILTSEIRYNEALIKSVGGLLYATK